jgi:protocatechuate 4,5-dioxygenase alpha chain
MTDAAEFDDIPGTVVFTAGQSRKGYQLNQFCMSLRKPENRERFKVNEAAYLDEWPLNPAQRRAVLDRDYNRAIAEGGNIYFLAKLISADGHSMQFAASLMSGMTIDAYVAMMVAGGRRPEGWRSIKDGN